MTGGTLRDCCPACGSADLAAAFTRAEWRAAAPDMRQDDEAAMQADPDLAFGAILRCSVCGTVCTDRVPTPAALGRFYGAYRSNTAYLAKLDKKLARDSRRLAWLKRLVRGRRFLDVGCNIGCTVEAARRHGFDATGLELGEDAVAIARERFPGNEFLTGTLDALPPGRQFDLVQCVEVIEHVPDVPRFAAGLAATVAPGGVLFLTTPDAGHWRVRGDLLRWEALRPPEHLALFTRAGVRAALAPHFRRIVVLPNAKPGVRVLAFKGKS
ncbi:methyltransferase domain-containing protein [Acidocella aromatica]|uniref:SAM-dependent methyltransferase n=1 Tax=Acidocella aromatica TaxID=1303579 RepID=A0A840VNV2_9PROT|nr:SAM-dependent methyltransferase [Acidocella aromatica]